MAANEVTLLANIRSNAEAVLRRVANAFAPAVNGAKNLENNVVKAGAAFDTMGAKSAKAAAAQARSEMGLFRSRIGRANSAANLALNTAQQFADPSSTAGQVLNTLSTTAGFASQGAMVGGPLGGAIGATVGALVSLTQAYKTASAEIAEASRKMSDSVSRQYAANDVIIGRLRELAAIDTSGFSAIEAAAHARLVAEQTAALNTKKTANETDTQTLGDRAIVELAKIREAAERQAEYMEKLGYQTHAVDVLMQEAKANNISPRGRR